MRHAHARAGGDHPAFGRGHIGPALHQRGGRGQRHRRRPQFVLCGRDVKTAGGGANQRGQFVLGGGTLAGHIGDQRPGVAQHGLRAVFIQPGCHPAFMAAAGEIERGGIGIDRSRQQVGFGIQPAQPGIGIGHCRLQCQARRGKIGLAGGGIGARSADLLAHMAPQIDLPGHLRTQLFVGIGRSIALRQRPIARHAGS